MAQVVRLNAIGKTEARWKTKAGAGSESDSDDGIDKDDKSKRKLIERSISHRKSGVASHNELDSMSCNDTMIEMVELDEKGLSENDRDAITTFSDSISYHVFVKKEPSEPDNINPPENTPNHLNDALGKGLKIGLNDRLAFIKNLFDESPQDYQRVISQISVYESFEEAQDFIENFVKPEYNFWEEKESFELRFYKIIEQNFS